MSYAEILIAAAGVVLSILVPMAGFFMRMEARVTRVETLIETALEVRAVHREAARPGPQAVRAWR